MAKYSLIQSSITVEDKIVDTYGIACLENNKITQCIHDISPDKDVVLKTIKAFNDSSLSPEHFIDAVEDSII